MGEAIAQAGAESTHRTQPFVSEVEANTAVKQSRAGSGQGASPPLSLVLEWAQVLGTFSNADGLSKPAAGQQFT